MHEIVTLEQLRSENKLLAQLSYPSPDRSYAEVVLEGLEELGVEGLKLETEEQLKILGKGFRNIIFCGIWRGERIAVKVRRIDYSVKDTGREAYMLASANSLGVGPKLLGHKGPVIIMSLVQGPDLTKWLLQTNPPAHEARRILLETAKQCYTLDKARIDHGELSDASKHVIIALNHPTIIDFGSAAFSTRPKNLTSIINYTFSRRLEPVVERLGLSRVEAELLKKYKQTFSEEAFRAVLAEIGLV